MEVAHLKINPEYEKLLPKLSNEEFESLRESIRTEGQHYPIIINELNEVLDGHHRNKACQQLCITPKVEVKNFPNKLLEKKFVIESNLRRRQLTTFQRAKLVLPLLEIEKELAKSRQEHKENDDCGQNCPQLAYKKTRNRKPLTEEQKEARRIRDKQKREEKKKAGITRKSPKRARKIVAKKAKISEGTLEKVTKIQETIKKEPEKYADLLEKLEEGTVSVAAAHKKIKRDQLIAELQEKAKNLEPPNGKFDVFVIDPAWNYGTEYNADGRRCASPYPEMPLEEIKKEIEKIQPRMEENCVVWLWTTNGFLHEAYHVLEAWGLTPKAILTWVKDRIGLGDWLRNQTEHCILAVKGSPKILLTNQSTFLQAKNNGHSEKPDEFYALVESLCIGKKADWFGRKEREGWEVYGTKELTA